LSIEKKGVMSEQAGASTEAPSPNLTAAAEAQAQRAVTTASNDAEDKLLVRRVLAGEQQAFATLLERYRAAVYNLCYRMLNNGSDAEDAGQEAFLRAYTQMHTYQPDRRFATWLLSIAAHLCIDTLRRRRRPIIALDAIELWKKSDEPEPEEAALDVEMREEVRELLDHLPEKYRLVTVLRYWHDLSYAEIAEVTDLSESAVKTQLHRARKMLAGEITKRKGARDDGLRRLH